MKSICPHNDCTGCALCAFVCPKACIAMRPGALGHLYPHIDASVCIDCGACVRACPSAASAGSAVSFPSVQSAVPRTAFAAWANDNAEYLSSASGGAASVLSRLVLSDGGVVYGSTAGSDGTGSFSVRHIRVDSEDDLWRLKGSK